METLLNVTVGISLLIAVRVLFKKVLKKSLLRKMHWLMDFFFMR